MNAKKKKSSPLLKKTSPKDHYGYLHGYSEKEQDRLFDQAEFFEPTVYEHINWPPGAVNILEPGCGVGAQSEILLKRYSNIKLTSIDRSPEQLKKAQTHHKNNISKGKIQFVKSEVTKMPFRDSSFDGAFICYLLEHVPEPKRVLEETHRVLKPGSKIFCTEVFNSSFYLSPYAPSTLKYYFEFNDHQWESGGNPFMGAHLGTLLADTGFQNIQTRILYFLLDKRVPKQRTEHCRRFLDLLMSAAPELLKSGRVTKSLVEEVKAEWHRAEKDPNSIIFYSIIQATATAL